MPPGPQPPAKEKRNWPGLLGGIAGVLLSLGAAVIATNVAALAFGFEATQKGYGAAALAVLTCIGVVCGGFAVQGSFKGRPVFPLIAISIITAVVATLGCLNLI